ncbi:MAG: acyl-CoA thioesterase [Desulfovibrio sp.]|jgi:acyl-CoA thioester hydrolase|nr:acyl-CoA thioesterase [Desulfovibrio sp.]
MSPFPVPEYWHEHRVSYGETDTMGVLYYAEYLHIFERSRNGWVRAFGTPYKAIEERGLFLPVREAGCRYRHSARYDDLVQVRTGVNQWRRASLTFLYEVYDESRGRLLAEGFTQHACVDGTGRPLAWPSWFLEIFRPACSGESA